MALGPNGCSYYRSELPARALNGSIIIRSEDGATQRTIGSPDDADTYIFHRPIFQWELDLIAEKRRGGAAIVVDVDDWLFDLGDSHEQRHLYDQPWVLDNFRVALSVADVVTTSTHWLADHLPVGDTPVFVCENRVDLDRFFALPKPRDDVFVIGWSGSVGHGDQIKRIAPDLKRILDEYPQARFVCMGQPWAHIIDRPEQCQDTGYVPLAEHPKMLSQCHVLLAPSGNSDFYAAKSGLRAMEGCAAGSVVIADGPTYQGLRVTQTHSWYHSIRARIDDPVGLRNDRYDSNRYAWQEYGTDKLESMWKPALLHAHRVAAQGDPLASSGDRR